MPRSVRTRGGAKRGAPKEEPDDSETPERSPPKKSSSTKTSSAVSEAVAAAVAASTKVAPTYPPISASTIKSLRWGDARDLMLPLLSEEEQANIHKKTRADLAKLLEANLRAGNISSAQFWTVAGLDKMKAKQKKKSTSLLDDPMVAAALMKHNVPVGESPNAPTTKSEMSPYASAVPLMQGVPYPRRMHVPAGSPPGALIPGPRPLPPLPRVVYKYTLRVPASIWPSTNYPPGIVVGEPTPPSPVAPYISGVFYSSGILAIGGGDNVIEPGNAKKQIDYVFTKLDLLLTQLGAAHADIQSMTAQVVDIHENGKLVLDKHSAYMAGKGSAPTRGVCAWKMVGVSGLYPEGCVVQLEVEAIVRRGLMVSSSLTLL